MNVEEFIDRVNKIYELDPPIVPGDLKYALLSELFAQQVKVSQEIKDTIFAEISAQKLSKRSL